MRLMVSVELHTKPRGSLWLFHIAIENAPVIGVHPIIFIYPLFTY